ncbi:MAG: hypothetical protein WC755_05410 [Candidatus Woesearchaeota archaeon]|jgi:hypothetical protein
MGFLDEVRKKNKLAKSLVSNGLAPSFDVAVKMAEARMRVESGAQDPIESAQQSGGLAPLTSTNVAGLRSAAKGQTKEMSLEEQKKASIMIYRPSAVEERKIQAQQTTTQTFPPIQHTQTTTNEAQEGTKMVDVEKILSENTKFITEQLIDFKSQLGSLIASTENMKQELASVKQDINQLKSQPRMQQSNNTDSSEGHSEAHTDASGGQHFVIQPPHSEHHGDAKENPRGDPKKIDPDSVSIEKMFNFSHKKF